MITYCVGSSLKKREQFVKNGLKSEALYADNDEVLRVISRGDDKVFIRGKIPFSNMCVGEYIRYQRATTCEKPTATPEIEQYNKVLGLGLKFSKKMGALDLFSYRKAQILSRYNGSVRQVYVNFDGLLFSKRNNKKLQKLLESLKKFFTVFVAVTDYRFIPSGQKVKKFLPNGDTVTIKLGDYVSRKQSKKSLPKVDKSELKRKIKSVVKCKNG